MSQRIAEPLEHLAIDLVVIADNLEPNVLAGFSRQVPDELRVGVRYVGQRGSGQVDGPILHIDDGLLSRGDQFVENGHRHFQLCRVADRILHQSNRTVERLGIDPKRANLVNEPEESRGVDADGLAETLEIERSQQTT